MTAELQPRTVTSVLVEEGADSVTVTWGLGEPTASDDVEFFGYGIDYYGPDGNNGKRFGVRFHSKTSAHVWDNASGTQANYEADSVTVDEDRIVVHYRDASIGLEQVGTIRAFAHIDGHDAQVDLPVTLLR